ncbi:TonB-dependent siderophore receptor [uncultured Acinetobacter sp.]|uniref:TonB-dependent siderophore receptor n=1 Tax=uncultured Acinetobacter sp. TaxID=165433 RepID=UPI0025870FB5|nr:TonB-dependent siderophore receptor [uncultured Acinetobacter sp.]
MINAQMFPTTFLFRCLKMILGTGIGTLSTLSFAETQSKQLETIVLSANQQDSGYLRQNVNLEGFGTTQLKDIPASVSVVSSARLEDQQAKVLTDVIKNDAALGDGYAAIGYYPNFVSRGFALALGSSYLLNGYVVRGEQNIALENKDRIETLKGISAIQSGMSTPGGVVNYVTKRPEDIRSVTVGANSEGGTSIGLDVGGFLGKAQTLGYRVNLAEEQIHPYVEHANGQRVFGSLALDWQIDDQSQLQFDIESQRQKQRSVPGYQLLDGSTVPTDVAWSRLLGYQSWSKPVTNVALNTSLTYRYQINSDWAASIGASYSHVKIDDYIAFPYGSYKGLKPIENTFDADGNYDLYDYRSPDDVRMTTQLKSSLRGQFETGTVYHHLNFELAAVEKNQKRYVGINTPVGTGNIYQDTTDFEPATFDLGNRYKPLESKQLSVAFTDRMELDPQWTVLLGGKWIDLNEKAYDSDGTENRHTDIQKFLPQMALSYRPLENTIVYLSYAKGLADGGTAPWYTSNANQVLAPVQSRQYELGFKQQYNNALLSLALFDLKQNNQFVAPTDDGNLIFIEKGDQRSQGIEFGLTGKLSSQIELSSSLALMKSRWEGSEVDAYEGHQIQNVPKLRFATHVSYDVAQIDGLRLLAGIQYSASKYANKSGTVKVGGYSVFDLGAAYAFKVSGYDSTLRLTIDNLFNKQYWRDVGGFMGDDYLFLGAPRTAQVSLNVKF